jgi:transposase
MNGDPAVDLWALDEVHFQQYGSRCRMWVPPEDRNPVLLHHPTRKSVGYFGAVRLRDGMFVYVREHDRFNGQSFWDFMKFLQEQSQQDDKRIVVVTDNAKYHHATMHKSWREEQEPRFVLDYLPPYSPDLNPIERVWKLTRRLCLHDQYFPTLTSVIKAVEDKFTEWTMGSNILAKLCAL